MGVAACLATAARVIKGYNDTLAAQSLTIAETLWNITKEKNNMARVELAVELFITTKDKKYADFLIANTNEIAKNFANIGWIARRALNYINDNHYKEAINAAAKNYYATIVAEGKKTPYRVPYEPNIWGAGWGI